jgi:hypothetical protein
MTKALTNHYLAFAIACLFVIATFITATNFTQLALAALLYPILMFFTYKMYTKPKSASAKILTTEENTETAAGTKRPAERIVISDVDKRVFLKLIGSAGAFLFLFSLFNKKAENMFYKSLPETGRSFFDKKEASRSGTGGTTITQPTDEYGISEIDNDNVENSYYGYTKLGGAWYIMKVESATNSFRYIKGDKNFPASWKNREKLKYDYFGNVF